LVFREISSADVKIASLAAVNVFFDAKRSSFIAAKASPFAGKKFQIVNGISTN
jgi:hypothetical protein